MDSGLVQKDHPYKHWEFIDQETGDRLRIVPERGGLITEWRCNGREVLYFDLDRFESTEKSVRGGIPLLFPICGDLPGNLLRLPQGDFPIHQHGFVRDFPWKIKPLDHKKGVVLNFVDNAKTRESFPFKFLIDMELRLDKNSLLIKILVRNLGHEKMPFSFGLHPYFRITNLENIAIRGLSENCTNHLDMSIVSTNSQLAKLSKGIDFLASSKGSVSLLDFTTGAVVEMQTQDPMDLPVIWTDPPRPMVCIEPWTSPRRSLLTGDRTLFLEPGTSKELISNFISN